MKLSQKRLARPSVGGLLATRQGSLAVALLCAACAAGILMFALGRYKSNLRTQSVAPTETTVLVATGEIQKGTSGDAIAADKLYKPTTMALSQVTPGAMTDASQLSSEVAGATILPGQQLTTTDFVAGAGVAGVLAPKQRAISVSLDSVHADTDVLQAGDRVDIYDTTYKGVVLLEPDALVLQAPGVPTRVAGQLVTGGSLVLVADTAVVPEIDYANDHDKLYLALRGSNAAPASGGLTNDPTIVGNSLSLYPAFAIPNTNKANSPNNANNGQ